MSQAPPELAPDLALCKLCLCDEVLPDLALVYGQNLFCGPVRSIEQRPNEPAPQIPQRAVFVLASGGEPPKTQHDGTCEHNSLVQVWVRGERGRFEAGQELARACWYALHDTRPEGYMVVECQESEPRYNGPVEDLHTWVIVLRVQYFS